MTNAEYFYNITQGKKKRQRDDILSAVFRGPAKHHNATYVWLNDFEKDQYRSRCLVGCPRAVYHALYNLQAATQFWWFNDEYDGQWKIKEEKLPTDLAIASVLKSFVGGI